MNAKEFTHPSGVWTHSTNHVVVSGKGSHLTTADGRTILDFTAGIGVNSTGHCHPKVVEAVREQAGKLFFTQINCVWNDKLLELTDTIASVVPKHLDKVFLSNSGAEAIEAAVKLAKHATGRSNVIVMEGSFHGRTHLAMAMTTSKTGYRLKYAPLPAGIYVAPYPYAQALGMTEEQACKFCLDQLELVLHTQTDPTETAAIVVEPIQGEGGYVVPPKGYLEGIRKICDEHGILLVIDEIQSGFCRSGKWFAHLYDGIEPDIMTIAKGMGSGFPISGIVYRSKYDAAWIPGSHGGTYGGGPLAAAASLATIGVMKDENLPENARVQGERLVAGLKNLAKTTSQIGDIRGRGMMIGVEFLDGITPLPKLCSAVLAECYARDLLLISCGIRKNVVRWIPPLVATSADIDEGLSKFSDAVAAAVKKV